MGFTIREFLEFDVAKDFQVVVGGKTLENEVLAPGILDFEFNSDISLDREYVFFPGSFVLSSLLFAKDNPELLYSAVERLADLDACCLAYKSVIFDELPQKVLDLAEKRGLCILRFGDEVFFEDIVYTLMTQLDGEDKAQRIQELIGKMLAGGMNKKQISSAAEYINKDFRPYISVVSLILKNGDITGEKKQEIIENAVQKTLSGKLKSKCAVCGYNDSIFLMISNDFSDEQRFRATLQDLMYELDIYPGDYAAGYSRVYETCEELDKAVREAFYARMAADIEGIDSVRYADLRMYRMICENTSRKSLYEYMEEYFAPIRTDSEGGHNELMTTAIEYVLCDGDLDLTSEKLFCHKNTVRYRIAKLQEKLAGISGSKDFFAELSLAVRICMVKEYLEKEGIE